MEEVVSSNRRSTNSRKIKQLGIVKGNPKQEIDRFHGSSL